MFCELFGAYLEGDAVGSTKGCARVCQILNCNRQSWDAGHFPTPRNGHFPTPRFGHFPTPKNGHFSTQLRKIND